MNSFAGKSISRRFTYSLISAVVFISLIFSTAVIVQNINAIESRLEKRLADVSKLAEESLSSALWQFNYEYVDDFIESLFLYEDLVYARLLTGNKVVKAKAGAKFQQTDFSFFKQSALFIVKETEIRYQGQAVGRIQLAVTRDRIKNTIIYNSAITIVLLLLIIGAILSITYFISRRYIFNPLLKLENSAAEISAGDLDTYIDTSGTDEIGKLANAFDRMIKNLKFTTTSLEREVEERRQAAEELRKVQEQFVRREKLAVLGQLSGSVSHELRNPLGVISNAVYYLKMVLPDADATVKKYLETISQEVNTSNKIISDLLDISRSKPVEREDVDFAGLISHVKDKHHPPKKIEVTAKFGSDLPPLYVDRLQIDQVFSNLITNAYQAMPDGGKLMIEAEAEAEKILVSFIDTGSGISSENMEKVFEPLFTTKAKGIGLGLAVAKNLVEANGGTIEAKSEKGKGSTFNVILPAREIAS